MLASSHGLIKQAEGYVPAFRSIHSGSLALRLSANSSLMADPSQPRAGNWYDPRQDILHFRKYDNERLECFPD